MIDITVKSSFKSQLTECSALQAKTVEYWAKIREAGVETIYVHAHYSDLTSDQREVVGAASAAGIVFIWAP